METADKYCCRTLPMRNWYTHRCIAKPDAQYSRTLPMRNWYCQASAGKRHSPSRTLPMRNWYMHLLHLMVESCSQLHQVGHYLWGIDTFQSCSCTFARALMVGHYLWGIDTYFTCFSINYIFHRSRTLPMRNWYMSIKQIMSAIITDIGRTLPMRNWYLFYPTLLSVSYFRRTLPMRNWYVHQLRYLPEFLLKVGHYLWGIDT